MEFKPIKITDFSSQKFTCNMQSPSMIDKRIHRPLKICSFKDRMINYQNASDMVSDIELAKGMRYYSFIPGNFIFGDFIEAFCVNKNLHVKKMVIATLSLMEANVDSLENLIEGEYVDDLTLIVSDYFYAHERGKLIPYIYEHLDKGNKFQLSVCRSHAKITLIETHDGFKFVFHGSANLRSSDNIEQICIEENEQLYDFNFEFLDKISDIYKTVKKSVSSKNNDLWHQVEVEAEEVNPGREPQKQGVRRDRSNNPTF